jgi:hypothetical protein
MLDPGWAYNYGGLKTGAFPEGWGDAALYAHLYQENVTAEGKGRAAAELERRREQRERDRSIW